MELDARLDRARAAAARGLVIASGEGAASSPAPTSTSSRSVRTPDEACRSMRAAQQVLRAARSAALPHGRRDQRLRARRRPRARARLPLPRAASTIRKSTLGLPEVSSASIRDSAARCAPCASPASDRRDGPDADRHDDPRRHRRSRSGLVDRLAPAARTARRRRAQMALEPAAARSAPPLAQRLLTWPLVRGPRRAQIARAGARRARPRALPGALRDRSTCGGATARIGRRGLRSRSALDGAAVVHADLAQPGARVLPAGAAQGLRRQGRLRSPQHVHVVGAGVMGGDIAAWCALRGLTVTLQDRAQKYVAARARARARSSSRSAARDPAKRDETMARLTADVEGDGVPQADIVIEAIFENVDAKRELFARLEPRMKPRAILATNTSSIVLEQLADRAAPTRAARRPALLQSGGADAAGRSHRTPSDTQPQQRAGRASPSRARSTSCRCPAAARPASSSTAC